MSDRTLNVKFGADTSGFSKGANQVKSELTALNSAMGQNKKKQKELAAEIKSLESQQKALKQVMSQLKTPTKEMTEEANRLQKALDKVALQAAELKTEEQELKAKISTATKELKEQTDTAEKNVLSWEKCSKALEKAAQLTATGVAALFTYSANMAASADEINTISKETGLATDEIQKFMYASELIDVSLDTLTGSMSKLIKNMNTAAKGTGDAHDAFVALGVSITDDVTGNLRNNQDVFEECIAALAEIENETQRDAYAMSIFGKSAQELNPLILGGAEQLKQFGDELEREGLILDQMQLDKLNEFNDKIDTFKAKFQAGMMEASTDWVDAFDELLAKSDDIIELVANLITGFAKITGFLVDNKEAVVSLVVAYGSFKAVMSVGNLIVGVITATKSLTKATQAATVAQHGMNAACNTNPYVLLASVLLSVGTAIFTFGAMANTATESTNEFTGATQRLKESLEDTVLETEAEVEMLRLKAERYEELRQKVNLTAEEEKELYNIAAEIEAAYPNQISLIDNKTLAYKDMGDQLDILTEQMLKNARVAAIQDTLQQAYSDKIELEKDKLEKEEILEAAQNSTAEDYINAGAYLTAFVSTYSNPKLEGDRNREDAIEKAQDDVDAVGEAINELDEYISELESSLASTLGDEYSTLLNGAGETTANYIYQLQTLQESYTLVTSAEKEYNDTQALSTETLQSLVDKYPELQTVVNSYVSGLEDGEAVINRLNLAYENDVKNYSEALNSKLAIDEDYYTTLQDMNSSAIYALANEYGVDLTNYQNYAQAKLAIEKAYLTSKVKNWQKYYNAETKVYGYRNEIGPQQSTGISTMIENVSEFNEYLTVIKPSIEQALAEFESLGFDDDLPDYSKYYYSQISSNSGTTTSTSKEISIYEQARASLSKLINDRIDEINALTEAEKSGADERIAAIEKEIEAREKLADTEDLQKRIDFIKGQLKYSQLDDFERYELKKQLSELETQQADELWQASKQAEIDAIEAEQSAVEEENNKLVEQLQAALSYGNSLFTDLQNGYKSATTIANDNTKVANINVVNNALTAGQVTQIVRDTLGIEVIF